MDASAMEDVVMSPLLGGDMSAAQGGGGSGSPSLEAKETGVVWETDGGRRDVERVVVEEGCEGGKREELVLEVRDGARKAAEAEMVGDAAVVAMQASSNSCEVSCEELEEWKNALACCKAMEAEGRCGQVEEGVCEASKMSWNSSAEVRVQCKMSESGEYGESAEVTEGGEAMDDGTARRGMEKKGVGVSVREKGAGGYDVGSPGAAECKSRRPMVKRVMSRVEGKLLKREYGFRSAQRLDPETMTKKLESYSRSLKVRRAVKVAKRNHVGGTRAKRQHADMESTDSGSGEECEYGRKSYFGGSGAYTRQRTTRGLSSKRRKVADGSPRTGASLHLKSSDLMGVEYECVDGGPPAGAAKLRSAKSASVASSPTSRSARSGARKSVEPHVKLSIKSFTVPELFVDLPETASVASLKRAVMDAAMSLLGGGLRVRVLMQGKKVPDEGATLAQMGISQNAKAESLGFMLEPSPALTSSFATVEDPLLVLSRAANQPAPRYGAYGVGDGGVRCGMKGRSSKSGGAVVDPDPSFVAACVSREEEGYADGKRSGVTFSGAAEEGAKSNKQHGSERMAMFPHPTRVAAAGALAAIRAQADASRRGWKEADSGCGSPRSCCQESVVAGSGAMIVHPGVGTGDNAGGMALVPMRNKMSRALDNGKRRVRRPFSVSEVEALVHAVEKLGTGRWRDVKLRAFEQAKHRTYVDLKDKWKTLVHTARIAPHQRRGEPVPQELLERVTRAHAFWTAHAAKQQAELDL
ncbi:uncharacterized protein [Physcomitrium patens]|uniref:uncharacterized protein n=1 Tax=Physcomitrium patens TaxID=3218 RepID=UPI003CCDCCEB